jgi:hypothetical protein
VSGERPHSILGPGLPDDTARHAALTGLNAARPSLCWAAIGTRDQANGGALVMDPRIGLVVLTPVLFILAAALFWWRRDVRTARFITVAIVVTILVSLYLARNL